MPRGNLERVDDVRVLPVRVEGMPVNRGPDHAVDVEEVVCEGARATAGKRERVYMRAA